MNFINGKNIAVALITGLLVLATVENQAGETDLYLNDAIRAQVFEELKDNVQSLYEGDWLAVPIKGNKDISGQAILGIPVANRHYDVTGPHPGGHGVFN